MFRLILTCGFDVFRFAKNAFYFCRKENDDEII